MTIQGLIDNLQLWDDKTLEVFIPDNISDATGVNEITTSTELFDGFDKIIGIVIL